MTNAVWIIASKELRSLFKSAVALLFLVAFLAITLFVFFYVGQFFSRNLADVRLMFEWLPVLLIALVSATTMRAWAEERRAGTLEVLLTLPVSTMDLVVGKFLAGMGLVVIGLAFTLPLPIMVSFLGPLDWGPVIGGYFAAVLLASTYLAIGLCVSSRTDNQVVALMVTLLLGGLLYVVGTSGVTNFFSAGTAELLRGLGTGSRFESIERGVLDLRDIAYYASLTAFFLLLNGVFLERERLDTESDRGSSKNTILLGLVGLVAANVVMLNVWMAPVNRARVDLTANGDYTVSQVTREVLRGLDEPLTIRALVSERTHPALAPLLPQLRDMLQEYEIYGNGSVSVSFEDPNSDEDLEVEINEQYSIRPIPLSVADRHSQSIVNAYFHVLITYGDQFEVLSFQDLIEVRQDAVEGLQVSFQRLEYDLTRTIRKVTQEFQSIESLLAKLPEPAKLTAFVSPSALPEGFTEAAEVYQTVGARIAETGGENVTFSMVDPYTDPALPQQLLDRYGIQPLATDLFATTQFYLYLLVEAGEYAEVVPPRPDMTDNDLEQAIEAILRRATPGQLQKIALFTERPVATPNPNIPPQFQPPPPQPDYQTLQQLLGAEYEIERTELLDGMVPQDVDVLVVGKVGAMSDAQQFAIDQYLMRGGSVVALASDFKVDLSQQGPSTVPNPPALADLLSTYGVTIEDGVVMSDTNAPFPIQSQRRAGGIVIPTVDLVPYPFFPELRGDRLNRDQAAMAGVTAVVLPWSSSVSTADDLDGREVTWLMKTDDEATVNTAGTITPSEVTRDGPVFAAGSDPAERTMGVAITGRFASHFEGRSNPLAADGEQTAPPVEKSVADGRLVVVGSSELVSDITLQVAQMTNSEGFTGNLQLIQNLIDWSVEDTDLLSIRTAGAFARTLAPLDEGESRFYERLALLTLLFPILLAFLVPRLTAPASEQTQ